ncbi:MAG: hypothetical protein IJ144_02320 [Prevotella sp.]|nr:hypothetical protein [Prevotella sp.]
MKKTYSNPTLEVVKIETQQMIAVSGGFGEGTQDGSKAVARQGWFDDDADDE